MRPRRRSIQQAQAFTLIEVLIALGILGGAVVVIMSNVSTAIRMYRQTREMVTATSLARAQLDALMAKTDRLRHVAQSGPVASDPRYSYSVTVEQVPIPGIDAPDIKALYRATVVVSWDGEGAGGREVHLVRYLADERGDGKPWRGNIEGL